MFSKQKSMLAGQWSRAFWVLPRIGGGRKSDDPEQLDSIRSSVMSRYEMLRDTLGSEMGWFCAW